MDTDGFSEAFVGLTGHYPYPWQEALYERFAANDIPDRCKIPSGLGKTSMMAIWLIAFAKKRWGVPRRLVFLISRHAVLDSASDSAHQLRRAIRSQKAVARQLMLPDFHLCTPRKQLDDSSDWLADPSKPSIIVGTTDTIGSQLFFAGFGVSRIARPHLAALIGCDSLLVLDDANLARPLEMQLRTLTDWPVPLRDSVQSKIILKPRLLALSNEVVARAPRSFTLSSRDMDDARVKKVLKGGKLVTLCTCETTSSLAQQLAGEAWRLSDGGKKNARIVIFCDSKDIAEQTKRLVDDAASRVNQTQDGRGGITALLAGDRRGNEYRAVHKHLKDLGFLGGSPKHRNRPSFLIATRSGEVGIDLDSDHMVCDLVCWERMVQRLGRVNRFGDGNAKVRVMLRSTNLERILRALQKVKSTRTRDEIKSVQLAKKQVESFASPIRALPLLDGSYDASVHAIQELSLRAEKDSSISETLRQAALQVPLRPPLTKAVVDAWAMTSLARHSGRPIVAPWINGWCDDHPNTSILWRRYLPFCPDSSTDKKQQLEKASHFFEHAPPHSSEILKTASEFAFDWLSRRANGISKNVNAAKLSRDSVIATVLSSDLTAARFIFLRDLISTHATKGLRASAKADLLEVLENSIVVVQRNFGGLNTYGFLDHMSRRMPSTGDDTSWSATHFRVISTSDVSLLHNPEWTTVHQFVSVSSVNGEPRSHWLVQHKNKHGVESAQAKDVQSDLSHGRQMVSQIARVARDLRLSDQLTQVLELVATVCAQQSVVGQRGSSSSREWAALSAIAKDTRFQSIDVELQQLALHLVAALNGQARPSVQTRGVLDTPPSVLQQHAQTIALRFAELQKHWGPWGLAWWEALLRAVITKGDSPYEGATVGMRSCLG